jgi:hypothetical protein
LECEGNYVRIEVTPKEMLLAEYKRERHLYSHIPEGQIKLQIVHRQDLVHKIQFCGSGMFIPDGDFFDPGSRIQQKKEQGKK